MVHELPIGAFLLCLIKLCFATVPTFEKDIRFQGKLCSPISHDFGVVRRPLYCAVMCEKYSECLGYFHSASLESCFGVNVMPTLTSSCTTNETFKFYRKTACGDPPIYGNATIEDGNLIVRQFTCAHKYAKNASEIYCDVDSSTGVGTWQPADNICIEMYGSSCTTDSECADINGTCISNTCLCDKSKSYFVAEMNCENRFKLMPGTGGNGYNTGQLYMLQDDLWGNVCLEYWSWTATHAVCQDINPSFIYAGAWHEMIAYGRGLDGTRSYKLKNLDCGTSWNISSIADCYVDAIETNCDHNKDMGITCYESDMTGNVRLNPNYTKDGPESEHRLEVFYNDTWGSVCEQDWGGDNAMIACITIDPSKPRKDTECKSSCAGGPGGPYMIDEVSCNGDEPNLFYCRNKGWTGNHNCPGKELGILCKVA